MSLLAFVPFLFLVDFRVGFGLSLPSSSSNDVDKRFDGVHRIWIVFVAVVVKGSTLVRVIHHNLTFNRKKWQILIRLESYGSCHMLVDFPLKFLSRAKCGRILCLSCDILMLLVWWVESISQPTTVFFFSHCVALSPLLSYSIWNMNRNTTSLALYRLNMTLTRWFVVHFTH